MQAGSLDKASQSTAQIFQLLKNPQSTIAVVDCIRKVIKIGLDMSAYEERLCAQPFVIFLFADRDNACDQFLSFWEIRLKRSGPGNGGIDGKQFREIANFFERTSRVREQLCSCTEF